MKHLLIIDGHKCLRLTLSFFCCCLGTRKASVVHITSISTIVCGLVFTVGRKQLLVPHIP